MTEHERPKGTIQGDSKTIKEIKQIADTWAKSGETFRHLHFSIDTPISSDDKTPIPKDVAIRVAEVENLQQTLHDLGYNVGNQYGKHTNGVDGLYEEFTMAGVQKFQHDYNKKHAHDKTPNVKLKENGQADQDTINALNGAIADKDVTAHLGKPYHNDGPSNSHHPHHGHHNKISKPLETPQGNAAKPSGNVKQ